MRSTFTVLVPFALLMALLVLSPTILAQETSQSEKQKSSADAGESKVDSKLLGSLRFRNIGPALMSGRIGDIAIDSEKPNTWYVAVGSGGLWKTTNAGTTWTPIFDNYSSYSVGCVTIDPSNRHTIWVGTGENVGGRHVGYGDGIYVSHNGGKSFAQTGLKESEHISKILVDPRNSDVVYVAVQGPLWSKGGQRGLYKTSDGGKTWKQILAKGPWTGVTDIAMDHANPNVIYAATHQRHRTVAALLNAGPESGIHKSTDGGNTWTELKKGLPSADKGKIAIAVSPQKSNVVYASIELAENGGFYRSEDYGASWTRMSDYLSGGTGPHYYQEIYADPHRFDVVYHANVVLGRTEDGGRTFNPVGNNNKHVDNHAVAVHPTDPDMFVVGCDGGLYKTYDYGATYDFTENLPLTQFYKVDVDYDWPVYHVVGGTQDNNTQYGPTRTLSNNGIRNADWRITIGGDGHDCAIDPEDPNIIYCESQQGFLRRFDRKTGESVDIRPQPEKGEDDLRFNWDSPIHISPHSHTRLYFGSKKVHRSDDRGDSWTAISGDLSRTQDRFLMPMMGRIWSIDAVWDLRAMSRYGNVTSISESPVVEGLIYAGTDDGLIQVTEDGGQNWRKIDQVFGVPEYFFVNDIKADRLDADTVYACVDDHKSGDYKPYVIKSTDRGQTWKVITEGLPERHVAWRINQDHEDANLLFLATEFGVFASVNGGDKWIKMSAGLPTISVRDLEIQRRENDLVAATFGRGFYVLDDYSPLRHMTAENLDGDFHMFPIKKALWYFPEDKLGGLKGSQGDSYYAASNPPFGATFTYYLKDSLETAKQKRSKKEAKNNEAGKDNPYPGWDAIKAEDREEGPVVLFEISDSEGNVVDRFTGPSSSGIHRVNWNLRYAPLSAGGGGGRRFRRGGGAGPMAVPGTYRVTAYKRVGDETSQLGEASEFEVESIVTPSLEMADRNEVLQYQFEVAKLQQSVSALQTSISEAIENVGQMKTLIRDGRAPLALLDQAREVELKLTDAAEKLSGDPTRSQRSTPDKPSISSRISNALFGTFRHSYGPTKTNRRQFEIATEEFGEVAGEVRSVIEEDFENLKSALDDAGVPWTSGRKIPDR